MASLSSVTEGTTYFYDQSNASTISLKKDSFGAFNKEEVDISTAVPARVGLGKVS